MTPRLSVVPKPDDELLDAIRNSSLGDRAFKEKNSKLLEQRRALVGRMEQLDVDAATVLPKLQAAVDAALRKFLAAQGGLRASWWDPAAAGPFAAASAAARAELDIARDTAVKASVGYTTQRDAIEHELRKTASPLLAAFISEMLSEHARTRNMTLTVEAGIARNHVTGKGYFHPGKSNSSQIAARLRACRTGISTAEDMKLVADQSDVSAELQKIRDALPSVRAPK